MFPDLRKRESPISSGLDDALAAPGIGVWARWGPRKAPPQRFRSCLIIRHLAFTNDDKQLLLTTPYPTSVCAIGVSWHRPYMTCPDLNLTLSDLTLPRPYIILTVTLTLTLILTLPLPYLTSTSTLTLTLISNLSLNLNLTLPNLILSLTLNINLNLNLLNLTLPYFTLPPYHWCNRGSWQEHRWRALVQSGDPGTNFARSRLHKPSF